MILSLEEDVNIYFFNNENASYRKSYILYYAFETTLTDGYNSAESSQFYFSNF